MRWFLLALFRFVSISLGFLFFFIFCCVFYFIRKQKCSQLKYCKHNKDISLFINSIAFLYACLSDCIFVVRTFCSCFYCLFQFSSLFLLPSVFLFLGRCLFEGCIETCQIHITLQNAINKT